MQPVLRMTESPIWQWAQTRAPAAITTLCPIRTLWARLAEGWIALINSKPGGLDLVGKAPTDAVVADSHDRPCYPLCLQIGQDRQVAQDGHAVHAPTVNGWIGVQEPDDLVLPGADEDIEDNPAVAACPDNHTWLSIVDRGSVHHSPLSDGPTGD